MSDAAPLPGFDPPPPEESYGRRVTARHQSRIARGYHPFGRPLANNGETCGGCAHAMRSAVGRQSVWKCDLAVTHSANTDLRVSWPACDIWRAK